MPMIYVTLIGDNMVAASETVITAEKQAHEMLSNRIKDHISNVVERGDVRDSIRLRTVYVNLQK